MPLTAAQKRSAASGAVIEGTAEPVGMLGPAELEQPKRKPNRLMIEADTVIGPLEPAGMAKHVRVDREWHFGGLAEPLDEAVETDGADWPAAFGNEYIGVIGVLAS